MQKLTQISSAGLRASSLLSNAMSRLATENRGEWAPATDWQRCTCCDRPMEQIRMKFRRRAHVQRYLQTATTGGCPACRQSLIAATSVHSCSQLVKYITRWRLDHRPSEVEMAEQHEVESLNSITEGSTKDTALWAATFYPQSLILCSQGSLYNCPCAAQGPLHLRSGLDSLLLSGPRIRAEER